MMSGYLIGELVVISARVNSSEPRPGESGDICGGGARQGTANSALEKHILKTKMFPHTCN